MSGSTSFRPLQRSDFPLLQRWLSEPHVLAWWREPLDLAGVEAKYGPRVDGLESTYVFIMECGGEPVGWMQWYRWADYPAHAAQLGADLAAAGIDLAIGERNKMGLGIGPAAIRQFLEQIVFADPDINAVMCDPEEANTRSLRTFAKAGFSVMGNVQIQGEDYRRNVVSLSRPGSSGL